MQAHSKETIESEKLSKKPDRKIIAFLIGTLFLSILGLTIAGPVLPFIVRPYMKNPEDLATIVGWLASSYAICQFLAAPGLGVLSDRFGRRPILLICLFGSFIGYMIFGLAGALWMLFLGRIIDGLTGGDFSIMFAYIADITEPEERGKIFGMFGAAGGIGFIVGPVIGGFTAKLGYEVPIFLAAGLTLFGFGFGYFFLPESLSKANRATKKINPVQLNPFTQLAQLFALPRLRLLLLIGILYALPFAVLQSNLGVLIIDSLHWDPEGIGLIFLIVGGMDIAVQGVLIGRLLPVFGEVKLTIAGIVLQITSYSMLALTALTASWVPLIAGVALFSFSSGLIEPSLGGLVSRTTEPDKQGLVQGGNQALQSLTRIVGPLAGGAIYSEFGHATPYWMAAIIVGLGIVAVLLAAPSIPRPTKAEVPQT